MEAVVRAYQGEDLPKMTEIWNEVVEEGAAFPQMEYLDSESAKAFFASQSFTGVAQADGEILGLYILHPNNIGRCGHIANTSYAVKNGARGLHIGESLVKDSLRMGAVLGFRILQFNAVVKTNVHAIHLYERLGFTKVGEVPGGFLMKDGHYENILIFYHAL